jgi:hypothetical protein
MNASGNTITFAPVAAASPIKRAALPMHPSVSKGTEAACTTATLTVAVLSYDANTKLDR